ncbi:MAG: saccharopine dehydrogenase NADP-binding domain-containing protein [Verrucomicrobia bacterium]|nr:saccharopine dehydrogenase NADP-binding domain-containing protein [Cytophagales bacterium]
MNTASNNKSKRILILGAGRSATCLIEHLAQEALKHDWQLTVGDYVLSLVEKKTAAFPHVQAVEFDAYEQKHREKYISQADVVISMMPTSTHIDIARTCVRMGKTLITASYTTPEIRQLNAEAVAKNVLILMEMGLDPGLDHMSAMQLIDKIRIGGGRIESFKSYSGGILSEESDNVWGYKFTWNPRNVVIAGQQTVKFLENGHFKYIPYHQLFQRAEIVKIDGQPDLEVYANRDSLQYQQLYGLEDVKTMIRGTLRRKGFSLAWNLLIKLGITDDSFTLENSKEMTYREFVNSFLNNDDEEKGIEERIAVYTDYASDSPEMQKFLWLGLLNDEKIGLENASPARILQHFLEKIWALAPNDKDLVVMQHQIDYVNPYNKKKTLVSNLFVKGDNSLRTAMAKSVGYTMAVACKLVLEGKINLKGVHIPINREIYIPALAELAKLGFEFEEKEV